MYGVSFDVPAEATSEDFLLPLNKAKVMRSGRDVTVAAHSIGVQFAMEVRWGVGGWTTRSRWS